MQVEATIIHNGIAYNADLDMFLYLSPLLQNLYTQNSYNRPMYISDGLSEHAFEVLVTSINNRNCLNVTNSNSDQEVFSFLESCLVYHVYQFIEEACRYIVNHNKEDIIRILKLVSQYGETSVILDQYILSNIKSFCKNPEFLTVDYFDLNRIFESGNRKVDMSKDPEVITFIANYIKKEGKKEYCFLLKYVDFGSFYEIDSGILLEYLIQNDLIDFDFFGEKIVNDLKKVSSTTKNSNTQSTNNIKKSTSKQIEFLESKIIKTEKECKIELEKIEEIKNEQKDIQAESSKVESTLATVTKQSLNASNKIALLQKEKAELEQKLANLIKQEEESKLAKFEDEDEPEKENGNNIDNVENNSNNSNSDSTKSAPTSKQSISNDNSSNQKENNITNSQQPPQQTQQQSEGSSMPHWCPKAKLIPPEQPFSEDKFYSNIQKADNEMKIYPTEALKDCFHIFNVDISDNNETNFSSKLSLIDSNDRATMFDFLARYSVEFNHPEISASLASLLAATDNSCDDLAASLFLNAAEKNVPEAMLNIGIMSRLGRGIIQDDKFAAHMIVKAANIGLSEAISIVKMTS